MRDFQCRGKIEWKLVPGLSLLHYFNNVPSVGAQRAVPSYRDGGTARRAPTENNVNSESKFCAGSTDGPGQTGNA